MSEEINKFNPSNPIIPKDKEYLELTLSKDRLEVGCLFVEGGRVLKIKEKREKDYGGGLKDYWELVVVDPETFEEVSPWCVEPTDQILKEYSDKWISSRNYKEYLLKAKDYLFNGKEFEVEQDEVEETGLVHNGSKLALQGMYGIVEVQAKKLELLKNMSMVLIEQQKSKLDIVKRKMEAQITIFRKQMTKIMKVIGMIELYLGIEEELWQLQEGEPADINCPLSLRQLVLYADEELGNCDDGGIDYSKLHLFDEWLIKDNNYKTLLPEERGIVAIKPRRYSKEYYDAWENVVKGVWNKETYFLIRNGENIYRICTPHIGVGETMFPKRKEVVEMNDPNNPWGDKKIEDFKDRYMKFTLFLQGLLDRTEIFQPIEQGIKVSDIEDGRIQLIYDAEAALPTGRLSFKDWQSKINENVGRGSRIVLSPSPRTRNGGSENNYYDPYYSSKNEGFFKWYNNKWSCPQFPSDGLYTVEEVEGEVKEEDKYIKKKFPCIRYLPDEKTWTYRGGYRLRKKRITWVIDLDHSWYLNYDRISLDDVNFYLNSRIDRPNYLAILPLLRKLKSILLEETKKEDCFKQMLLGLAIQKKIDINEKDIDDALDWWKYKNIWKRPITQDDEKAVRMITKHLGLE